MKVDRGCKSSTTSVTVVAISAYHYSINDLPVFHSLLISRFIKAIKISNPSIKTLPPPWCLGSVLSVLSRELFEPMNSCDIKLLTWKTVFLLAICSARRISELQALSCSAPFTIVKGQTASLKTVPEFLPKRASDWHRKQSIELSSFYHEHDYSTVHNMCPVRALKFYLDRSKTFQSTDQLFVLHSSPKRGQAASKATIARWIVELLKHVYASLGKEFPTTVHAHQTRGVASTWAEMAKCETQEIMRAAMWSSKSTFIRHYRLNLLPRHAEGFSHKVLTAASSSRL